MRTSLRRVEAKFTIQSILLLKPCFFTVHTMIYAFLPVFSKRSYFSWPHRLLSPPSSPVPRSHFTTLQPSSWRTPRTLDNFVREIAQDILPDLPAAGDGVFLNLLALTDPEDMLRSFVSGKLLANPRPHRLGMWRLVARPHGQTGRHGLAVPLVPNADDTRLTNRWEVEQPFLDFERVDVLTS